MGSAASPSGSEALAELRELLAPDAVLEGSGLTNYLSDATEAQNLRGEALAVVLPESTEQVAGVMGWSRRNGVAVVPRGGGSGYAGGCVPNGGIVLSSERLRAIRRVEPLAWQIEVEAGLTTREVQRIARENGLYYPVDPGAAEQSHIGGNVATNAGGPHAFKYGVTADWVTGIEAVTAAGDVLRIGGAVRKDVAGYDLRALLCGSEGTLAFVTAVSLRMIPAVESRLPVVGFHPNAEAVGEAVTAAMASGVVPAAIEYLDEEAVQIARGSFPGPIPEGRMAMTIVEADGDRPEAEAGRALLEEALADSASSVWSPEGEEVDTLWRWREGVGLLVVSHRGGKMSEDVAVPVQHLAEMIEATRAIGRRHSLDACSWGHAGDGNLHSTFMFERDDATAKHRAEAASGELFEKAIALGGTISGEHGVGTVKNGQLRKQWGAAAVELHAGLKDLFDPEGRLNPGKKQP